MMYAYDFRKIARDVLRGKWGIAVIAGLIATLLGGAASIGPELELKISDSGRNVVVGFGNYEIYNSAGGVNWYLPDGLSRLLIGGAVFIAVAALVLGVLYFVLGSVIAVGYSRFNLALVDQQGAPDMGAMFGYFSHWRTTAAAKLFRGIYVFLWSLLFVIPGIVAGYSYAMTDYILAEQPELTASEALSRSKEMMYGNRWRLFCLQFSFIGWSLLCTLTLGIGNLWLNPYIKAATTAFYREVSGTWHVGETAGNGFEERVEESIY